MKTMVKNALREVLDELLTDVLKGAIAWYGANKAAVPADIQPFADELVVVANAYLNPSPVTPPVTK